MQRHLRGNSHVTEVGGHACRKAHICVCENEFDPSTAQL
jgi:hypothetical protein